MADVQITGRWPLRCSELLDQRTAARHGPVPLQGLPARIRHRPHVARSFPKGRYRHQRPDHLICIPSGQWQYEHPPFLPNMRQPDLWRELRASRGGQRIGRLYGRSLMVFSRRRRLRKRPRGVGPHVDEHSKPRAHAPVVAPKPTTAAAGQQRAAAPVTLVE
jgi:hypothetical protein